MTNASKDKNNTRVLTDDQFIDKFEEIVEVVLGGGELSTSLCASRDRYNSTFLHLIANSINNCLSSKEIVDKLITVAKVLMKKYGLKDSAKNKFGNTAIDICHIDFLNC